MICDRKLALKIGIISTVILLICVGIVIFLLSTNHHNANECHQRRFDSSHSNGHSQSFVCVCSAEFCDEFAADFLAANSANEVILYSSSKDSNRFKKSTVALKEKPSNSENCDKSLADTVIRVNASNRYQKMLGIGGAFTDAAGINLAALSDAAREKLLDAYFGQKGIDFTLGRVPIGSCDFSTRSYSYSARKDDFELSDFALAPEDFKLKIPFIRRAAELSGGRLRLLATPWTAPAWMKSNGQLEKGTLSGPPDGPYYRAFANYFVKFFEEYRKNGLNFWALTIVNQPLSADNEDPSKTFESMRLSSTLQRYFADNVLAETLARSNASSNVQIIAHDDQRSLLEEAARAIYNFSNATTNDPTIDTAIAGLATHWYAQNDFDEFSRVHEMRPDKFIIASEACAGSFEGEHQPLLGDWKRGEKYGNDTINSFRNWVTGWIDWNLALDLEGGPNWVKNYVDAPIIVDAEKDEFYKQPMYYFLGHFSKFVPPGSIRVESERFSRCGEWAESSFRDTVQHVAFLTPTDHRVMVAMNLRDEAATVWLEDAATFGEKSAKLELKPRSIVTAIWKSYPNSE